MVARAKRRLAAWAALVVAAFALGGCSSVVFIRNSASRVHTPPQFSSSKQFWLFGLVGDEYDVHIKTLCLGKEVDQVATFYDTQDVIAGLVTLGVYTPRTVGVWCRL